MKRYLQILFLFFLSACTFTSEQDMFACSQNQCPRIYIPTQSSYLTQIVNYSTNFRVELTGYESYCYTYAPANMRFAIITPYFMVRRLRPSKDTEVDFSFYTQTQKGPPEFLGKRSYFASVKINLEKVEVKGNPVKVRIPLDTNNFEISLGLDMTSAEKAYNSLNPDIYFATNTNVELKDKSHESKCGCSL